MTELSARLAMPLLQAGQAQKELTHNEALALVDVAVQASVVAVGANEPPPAPEPGQCWIVGPAPSGAWAGQAGTLAGWTAGGWRFLAPREGMAAWDAGSGYVVRRVGGTWVGGDIAGRCVTVAGKQVVGARAPAIAAPAGGAVVDVEARAGLSQILSTLRAHGLIEG